MKNVWEKDMKGVLIQFRKDKRIPENNVKGCVEYILWGQRRKSVLENFSWSDLLGQIVIQGKYCGNTREVNSISLSTHLSQ